MAKSLQRNYKSQENEQPKMWFTQWVFMQLQTTGRDDADIKVQPYVLYVTYVIFSNNTRPVRVRYFAVT